MRAIASLTAKYRFDLSVVMICAGMSGCSAPLPITGTQSELCTQISNKLQAIMTAANYKAGTISIAKGGAELCSNGVGYQDRARTEAIDPQRKMRTASVGKPVVAILIKDLIWKREIAASTPVFDYLEIPTGAASAAVGDAAARQITIQNLLDHKSGWDKAQDGFSHRALQAMKNATGIARPSVLDAARHMITQPLQTAPGEKFAYSNFGYALLKAVIEKSTGQGYIDYLASYMSRYDVKIIASAPEQSRDDSETWYEPEAPVEQFAIAISASDLVEIFTHYWVSGKEREGNGLSYAFYGAWDGTTAIIRQRADGYTYAVLLNTRGAIKAKEIKRRIDAKLDELSRLAAE